MSNPQDQQTLGEVIADIQRQNAQMSMASSRIDNSVLGSDASAAESRHAINMIIPKIPERLNEYLELSDLPSSVQNTSSVPIRLLEAPETMLTNAVHADPKKDPLTTRKLLALHEESQWDRDLNTPMIYRRRAEYMMMETGLNFAAAVLIERNVATDGNPNERYKHWAKKSISSVQSTFEEKKQAVKKGGIGSMFTQR